jgi:photosystem II stability/assembly factor-like uncharacterized protein
MNFGIRSAFIVILLFVLSASAIAQLHWRTLPSPTTVKLRAGVFISDKIGIAVGDSNTIIRTTNGGDSWTIIKQDTFVYPRLWTIGVNANDPLGSPIIASGDDSIAYRSIDGGATWSQITNGLPGGSTSITTHIEVLDDHTIYSAGGTQSGGGSIKKSTDRGATWENMFFPNTFYYIRSLHFFSDTTGVAIGTENPIGATILQTSDLGTTWHTVAEFVQAQFLSMCFTDRLKGYVVGLSSSFATETNGLLFQTQDGGKTWMDTKKQLAGLRDVSFIDNNRGFVCGLNHILETTDGGESWIDAGYSGSISFNSIYSGHGKIFAVGEVGQMVLADTGSVSAVPSSKIATEATIFPNPMTESATISFAEEGVYDVQVVGLLGQLVYKKKAGSSIQIQREDIFPGAYEVIGRNIRTGSIIRQKFIVQ